jgi:hypothetical protein
MTPNLSTLNAKAGSSNFRLSNPAAQNRLGIVPESDTPAEAKSD